MRSSTTRAITREVGFEDTTPEVFASLFDLNVRGYFLCAQRALRYIARGGALLNIGSIHAHGGLPGHTAYAATKGAIDAWTRSLSVELSPRGIRVNVLSPGVIEVPRYHERAGLRSQSVRSLDSRRSGGPPG